MARSTGEKTSLVDAYQNYGFAYGFTYTFADFGITRPSDYSEEMVEEIADDIADEDAPLVVEPEATAEPEEPTVLTPNVVFVQLESFFNVHDLLEAEYSQNPFLCFRFNGKLARRPAQSALGGRAARPTPSLRCFQA